MNNFSLGISQDETFVKASEIDALFDKNAIFKLQVIVFFLMHSFCSFIILIMLLKKQSIYFRVSFSFKKLSVTILMVLVSVTNIPLDVTITIIFDILFNEKVIILSFAFLIFSFHSLFGSTTYFPPPPFAPLCLILLFFFLLAFPHHFLVSSIAC